MVSPSGGEEKVWLLVLNGSVVFFSSFLVALVIMTLFLLVGTGFVRYFPPHVKTMYDRAMYYWSGDASVLLSGEGAGF